MLKRALLDHLTHRCYIKLAPSRISGVGVRAVCDIPPNTDPFVPPNAHLHPPEPPCIAVREDEIAGFPAAVRSQLLSFFAVSIDLEHMLNPNPNANSNAAAVTLTLTHPHISLRARLLTHR